ncbi:MAG: ATP-binding protein, partial [Actinomycetota bacterium]
FSSRLLALKGYPQAVPAYVVERPLLRPGRSRPTRLHDSPLIGRSEELFRILRVVRDTQLGHGGVVTLAGDAGVGKSRLLAEVKAAAKPSWRGARSDSGPSLLWLQGGCVEFGQAAGYHPFLELFRQWFSGAEAESEELRRQRLNDALEQLARESAIEAYLLPPLRDFASDALGLARLDASPRLDIGTIEARHRTFTAIRSFFRALASWQPLVLVLEDLHWADSLSLDLLATLLDMVQEVPLALICTYRADGEQSCQRLEQMLRAPAPERHTRLELAELPDEQSRQLIAALLPPDFASEELTIQIIERCRGNPFFIEEVVGALLQPNAMSGAATPEGTPKMEAVSVPAALQSVILSRIDRLPEASRILLQHAAVLGNRFQGRVLERLGHTRAEVLDGLSRLEEHRLVNRQGRPAVGEYAFNHALIQETIYSTLVKKKRVQLHQQAAEALERVYSGRLDQACEVIADHYSRTDCTAQAVRYLALAGRKANRLYANREAIAYYRRALETRSRSTPDGVPDDLVLEVLEALGEVLFRTGDHAGAETCFTELLAALPESTPPRRRAAALWRLADAVHWRGLPERAIQLADEGLSLLDPDCPGAETANLLEVSMRSAWAMDNLETASRYAARLEEITPRMDYFDAAYMIYYAQAWLAMQLKSHERAQAWLETMEVVCRRHGSENGLARCYHGLGDLSRATGDLEGAAAWFERSLEYCRRTGDAPLLLEGHLELAHALVLSDGAAERIEQHLALGMRIAEHMAATGAVSSVHTLCEALASAYLRRENPERAIHFFRRSFDFGPHPSPERPLQKLEPLYASLGRAEEFTEFARVIRRDG